MIQRFVTCAGSIHWTVFLPSAAQHTFSLHYVHLVSLHYVHSLIYRYQ